MSKRGRAPKLTAEQREELSAIVAAHRTATLEEIGQEWRRRTGITAHGQTLVAALEAAGWSRVRDGSGLEIKPADGQASGYGYTDAHRRLEPEQRYPSCLTHREWALVEDLFDKTGKRGVPPAYPRRVLVDACCYVVRTGCSWRMLPKEFPAEHPRPLVQRLADERWLRGLSGARQPPALSSAPQAQGARPAGESRS
jgi:predicted Zn-ribbon and HTH transcriptional regulator